MWGCSWATQTVLAALRALCRYVLKLVQELEGATAGTFPAPSDRDRAKSVLADLQKTAGDFRAMAGRALDAVAAGIVPRLRRAACAVLR